MAATFDEVRRIAAALPEIEESSAHGALQWKVGGKLFVWERPLRAKEQAELGAEAPDGDVLAARVPDEGAKHALIAADPDVYFTVSHFDGYNAVLVRLDAINADELEELVTEAWLHRAPPRLAKAFLANG